MDLEFQPVETFRGGFSICCWVCIFREGCGLIELVFLDCLSGF